MSYIEEVAAELNSRIKSDVIYRITDGATGLKIQAPHCRVRGIRDADPELDGPNVKGILFTYETYSDAEHKFVAKTIRITETWQDLQRQTKGTNQEGPSSTPAPERQRFGHARSGEFGPIEF